MANPKPDYNEFYDPRLVAIYNTVCPLDGYEKYYIDLAKKLNARTIIDIGCGTGLLTIELAKLGYSMVGVEPSGLMLDVARNNSLDNRIKWIQGDALAIGEYNADLAIMTGHVAQFHIDDDYWLRALKSIHRALRKGGHIAFESRNPEVQSWAIGNKNKPPDGWFAPGFRKVVTDPVAGEITVWTEMIAINENRTIGDLHYLFTKTGEEVVSRGEMIFRSRDEITKSLEEAGFCIECVYGNWDSSVANSESPEFIFIAKKE
jgi:SAM-dependent methyltransferase